VETSKRKPDLMSQSRHGTAQQQQGILATLEHGGRPQAGPRAATRQLDGWIVGVGSIVLVLAALAWFTYDKAAVPLRVPAGMTDRISGGAGASAQPTAPLPRAPLTPPHQASPVPGQAAAIINEAALQEPHQRRGPLASDTATAHAAFLASKKNGPAHAVPPSPQTARSAAAVAAAANPTPATAANAADTDIALLTALVAHANKPAAVAPERSRDVVERHDGDSTTSLLARCRQLGPIEGMLCRSRICSGRWESDSACRVPSR
jgi:hypothetical protein